MNQKIYPCLLLDSVIIVINVKGRNIKVIDVFLNLKTRHDVSQYHSNGFLGYFEE